MSKIDTIKEALSVLENIEAMKAELKQVQIDADMLRGSNEKLEAAKAKAKALVIANQQSEISAAAMAAETIEEANRQAQSIKDRAQAEYEARLDGMKAEIESQLAKAIDAKDKAEAQAADAESRLAALLHEVDALEDKKGALESAIAALRSAVSV